MTTPGGDEVGVRLRLSGRRQFEGDASSAARSIRNIGDAADVTNVQASGLSTQLGTLGRGIMRVSGFAVKGTGALLGVAGAGIGAFTAMGIQALSSSEQSQIAFETMLGSGQKARAFLGDLEKFAATTPFEMQGLTQASQGLLAFGFKAEQVIPMMTAIGDAASGLGAGQDGIDRMVRAMGQIQAKGKASAGDLLQLAEVGVPVWDMLAKKMGVDVPTAMDKVTRGEVDAATTIDALLTGMGERFGGLMSKQSQSIGGLWSTLKDTVRITSRDALQPFQADIKNALNTGITYATQLGDWFKTRLPTYIAGVRKQMPELGAALATSDSSRFVVALDTALGGLGTAINPITSVVTVVMDLVTVVRDLLIPTFTSLSGTAGTVLGPLGMSRDLLGWIADNASTLQPWLTAIIAAYILWRTATFAANVVLAIHNGILFVTSGRMAAMIMQSSIMRVATLGWAAAQWVLNVALSMNPIGLIVIAIVALIAIFVLAWQHSDTFRLIVTTAFEVVKATVMSVFGWIRDNWPLLLAILTGPIGLAVLAIIQNWDTIKNAATATKDWIVARWNDFIGFFAALPGQISNIASGMWNGLKESFRASINWIIDKWNNFELRVNIPDFIPGLPNEFVLSTPDVPRLHDGGVATAGGAAIIQPNEEMVVLPPAASVIPTPTGAVPQDVLTGGRGGAGSIVVPVYLNGRQIAEAVYDETRDRMARR